MFCLVWWNLVLSFWRRRFGKVVSAFSLFLISSNWKSVAPQIHLNISFFVLKTGYQYIPVFAYKQINVFIECIFSIYCQCWTINIYCVPDEKNSWKHVFRVFFTIVSLRGEKKDEIYSFRKTSLLCALSQQSGSLCVAKCSSLVPGHCHPKFLKT